MVRGSIHSSLDSRDVHPVGSGRFKKGKGQTFSQTVAGKGGSVYECNHLGERARMALEGKEQGRTAPGVPEICKGPAGNTWEVFGELRMGWVGC